LASLQATSRRTGDVTVVDFSGKIVLGEGSAVLRKTVRELIEGGHRKILLNLADVDYIDSSGIGELVSAFTTVRNQGGALGVCELCFHGASEEQIAACEMVPDPDGLEEKLSAGLAESGENGETIVAFVLAR